MSWYIPRKWTFRVLFWFFVVVVALIVLVGTFFIWPDTRAYTIKQLEAQQFRSAIETKNPQTEKEFWQAAHEAIEQSIEKYNPFNPNPAEIVDLLCGEDTWEYFDKGVVQKHGFKPWATEHFRNYAVDCLIDRLRGYYAFRDSKWDETTTIAYGASKVAMALKGLGALISSVGIAWLLFCLPWLVIFFIGGLVIPLKPGTGKVNFHEKDVQTIQVVQTEGESGAYQSYADGQASALGVETPRLPNLIVGLIVWDISFVPNIMKTLRLITSRSPPFQKRRNTCRACL